MIDIATRRDYICAEFSRCFAYVTDVLIVQGHTNSADAWRAAWQLGSEHFEEISEGNTTRSGKAVALVRVEFTRGESETLDNAAGRASHLVERAIQSYRRPLAPYENDLCRISIVRIDSDAVIPSYNENGVDGKIFIPVNMHFTQQWKKQR